MSLRYQWHCDIGKFNDPEMVEAKFAQTEDCNSVPPFETVQLLTAKDIATHLVEKRHWSELVVPSLSYMLLPLTSIAGARRVW
jgi:hypothetical protein